MPAQRALLPRSTPADSGISSRAVGALLDQLEAQSIECHSKSFTSVAVGLAIADGLLSLDDLVKGFLRVLFSAPEGTQHVYDNSTTFILARMVERVTGRGLPELLDERLFKPMGIEGAEWDRVASGAAFGFHGLHLTTEAVAAFGELLLRGGRWGDRQLVPTIS